MYIYLGEISVGVFSDKIIIGNYNQLWKQNHRSCSDTGIKGQIQEFYCFTEGFASACGCCEPNLPADTVLKKDMQRPLNPFH